MRKGARSLALRFDARDWKVLHHFLSFRSDLADFFGDLGFMERGAIVRQADRLLAKAQRVSAEMTWEAQLLGRDYSFAVHNVPGASGRGMGVIHGLRWDSRPVSVSAKPGHCWLEVWRVRDDGVGEIEKVVDLRGQTNLALDNGVSLEIRRSRPKGLAWTTELPKLISFLEEDPHGPVEIENSHTG